jgi:Lar family restriction alleviation protein
MSEREELLPCPFCGGAAERVDIPAEDIENGNGSCIQCTRCMASTALHFDRKENLVSSWNDRCQPAATVQVTGEMVGRALEAYRDAYYSDDLEHEPAMKRALEAALQAGVPAKVTPMMVGNAIATYHATDGDWWKVCAEILAAAPTAAQE